MVSTNASYTFTVTGNRTLVANFTANPINYTISVSSNPSNGGTVNGGGTCQQGSNCTVTATANPGYTFSNWTENGTVVSTSANYTFTVTGNRSLVANFTQNTQYIKFDLNDTYGDGWTGNYLVVNYGDRASEQLTISSGYSASYMLQIPDGSHVTLTWIAGSYTNECSFLVSYPNDNVIYTGVNMNASFMFEFVVDYNGMPTTSFGISVSANPSAGGSVNGTGNYNCGSNCTVTATANSGYTFTNWTENGNVVSTNASYSFTVTGNRTLVANFTANPVYYTISVSASPSNGGSVSGNGAYQQGSNCTVTATANSGYTFTNWTENGSVVSTNASYTFIVSGSRSLVANFTDSSSLDVVEIGDGGVANNKFLPSYSYYNYSLTQQIYTADEIGISGMITSIAFKNTGAEKTRTYKVYMLNTYKDTFENGSDWVFMDDDNLVFEDEITFMANEWTTLDLDTPFEYDGVSNLLVCVADVSGAFTNSPHMACLVFDATSQSLYAYRDLGTFDVSTPGVYGTVLNVKNQIQLGIVESSLDVVEIGDGGVANNKFLPSYSYYNYSLTQQIYTADEIGISGMITSIAFKNTGAEKTRTYKVYMLNTYKDTFENGSDWVFMDDDNLVFEDEITFMANEWTTLDLDTPFEYDGVSNLLVCVADVSGAFTNSPHMACLVFDATSQSLYAYRDLGTFDVSTPGVYGTVLNVKNQVYFGFTQEPSTVTQTLNLASGWNWVSFNVEVTMDDVKAAVVAATPGAAPVIKSKGSGQTSYNGAVWVGALKTLDLSQMYEIKVANACTVTLEGIPVNPADHPATIKNGVNWIAYPLSETKSVANAFAGFPVTGDNVKSKDSGQATWNGVMWLGALKNLVPGTGYLYISKAAGDKTLTF